jgi:hypothetical protein
VLAFELAFERALADPNFSQNKSDATLGCDLAELGTFTLAVFSQPFV